MVGVLNIFASLVGGAFGYWVWTLSNAGVVLALICTVLVTAAFHILYRLISGHWLEPPVFSAETEDSPDHQ